MASTITHSPAETFDFGRTLAATLRKGDVLALAGDLGAGKTQLVKGIAAGLGIAQEVTSPTFTLIHEHPGGKFPLFHIDLYRLDSPDEALKIGLDEYLSGNGVTVIEWADKFAELVPGEARWVRLLVLDGDLREIETP
ncbi:MAG TPA: tRNA (adenosine(37)-N6)-threonylcarbamoyltransferase complex ATPase subunit type 1 TsaE [Chthoniobacteraceae bacterium]|nr:tRNA (adenosine(37)-N6)-threonylcarbamoyltransferase complex ATPase subunit type 1 TsaE [Chthoniobacteraceae bacterium]